MNQGESDIKKLQSLLDKPSILPIEKLPPPKGIPRKNIEAVKGVFDDKIYDYEELATRISQMPDIPKIATGMKTIDNLLDGGWQAGELIVLAAPPKHGKSQMCFTLTYNQSLVGISSLWFTLEMSWQDTMRRFMAMDMDWKISKKIVKRPIFCPIDTRLITLEKIKNQIIKAKLISDIKMVYIDHLQRLYSSDELRKKNVPMYIGELIRELKDICNELQVTIILITHMTKVDVGVMPDISSLRDSNMISAESDLVFVMWRERIIKEKKSEFQEDEDVYSDRTFLALEANRRNGVTKRLQFAMKDGMFIPYNEYNALQWAKYPAENKIDNATEEKKDMTVKEVVDLFEGEII